MKPIKVSFFSSSRERSGPAKGDGEIESSVNSRKRTESRRAPGKGVWKEARRRAFERLAALDESRGAEYLPTDDLDIPPSRSDP